MPVIRVEMSSGRTRSKKQEVTDAITQAMMTHRGSTLESIHVEYLDVPASAWAIDAKFLAPPSEA
ncbi:tautomerase family protein [Burkholderia sp. BCC0322]|uniref:tautomerase family protein n=1 Tax=unclassified Burkholderia TaxID=2613784 RepID=UPI00158DECBE|nr:tautomerase family protein [Burkholderia sp. BCC0322]